MKPTDSQDRTARIQALRKELSEVQAALDRFKAQKADEGWALMFRYIASRVAEISKALAEFNHVENGGDKGSKTTAA